MKSDSEQPTRRVPPPPPPRGVTLRAASVTGVAPSKIAAPPSLRLKVVEPAEQRGRTFDLVDELTIGRAAGCHVSLDDRQIARVLSGQA